MHGARRTDTDAKSFSLSMSITQEHPVGYCLGLRGCTRPLVMPHHKNVVVHARWRAIYTACGWSCLSPSSVRPPYAACVWSAQAHVQVCLCFYGFVNLLFCFGLCFIPSTLSLLQRVLHVTFVCQSALSC